VIHGNVGAYLATLVIGALLGVVGIGLYRRRERRLRDEL
jgi:hypothetical protein